MSKLHDAELSRCLENCACPLNADCMEAYTLLDECERWLELGLSEFLPDFARPKAMETHGRVKELLDRVLGRKKKAKKGGRPKKVKP